MDKEVSFALLSELLICFERCPLIIGTGKTRWRYLPPLVPPSRCLAACMIAKFVEAYQEGVLYGMETSSEVARLSTARSVLAAVLTLLLPKTARLVERFKTLHVCLINLMQITAVGRGVAQPRGPSSGTSASCFAPVSLARMCAPSRSLTHR